MRISSLGFRFVADSPGPATIFHRSRSFVTVSFPFLHFPLCGPRRSPNAPGVLPLRAAVLLRSREEARGERQNCIGLTPNERTVESRSPSTTTSGIFFTTGILISRSNCRILRGPVKSVIVIWVTNWRVLNHCLSSTVRLPWHQEGRNP